MGSCFFEIQKWIQKVWDPNFGADHTITGNLLGTRSFSMEPRWTVQFERLMMSARFLRWRAWSEVIPVNFHREHRGETECAPKRIELNLWRAPGIDLAKIRKFTFALKIVRWLSKRLLNALLLLLFFRVAILCKEQLSTTNPNAWIYLGDFQWKFSRNTELRAAFRGHRCFAVLRNILIYLPMIFPWSSHDLPMIFPWSSY